MNALRPPRHASEVTHTRTEEHTIEVTGEHVARAIAQSVGLSIEAPGAVVRLTFIEGHGYEEQVKRDTQVTLHLTITKVERIDVTEPAPEKA